MSEEPISSVPSAATPDVRKAQRWNIVWVVPLVALALGAWLLYRSFAAQGPRASVEFETATGIYAGKTEVRCRSVTVGVVKEVKLAEDLKSVRVHLELATDAAGLLRTGTLFWVVKPRFSVTEFSGAETLITGAYIELDPGPPGGELISEFVGLEIPPTTNSGVPGLRLILSADEAGQATVGAPIYFRGFEVGRVESRQLDKKSLRVIYNAFIEAEYSALVTGNTRFWNTSGIDISAGADGFKVRTPSLQAMVSGGVTFGVAEGDEPGERVRNGATFTLHRDEDAARQETFNPSLKLLLLFDQSVRGLKKLAPVEFRGIPIGRVADISFDLVPGATDKLIPVLIEIDPALMRPEVARELAAPDSTYFKVAVSKGLRAALKTGSLITGALFVDLDYYKETPFAELSTTGEFTTIPTVSSGFAQLEAKLTAIMDKIQAVPIDKISAELAAAATEAKITIAESRTTLKEIEATASAARQTLEDPELRGLPADLRKSLAELQKSVSSVGPDGAIQGDLLRTLDELRAALRGLKAVTTTIDEKPNSILFGRDSTGNPIPKAPRSKR